MTEEDAFKGLLTVLQSMPAAGPAGFEGLARALLEKISGLPCRIAKSGPQGGTDVRSQGSDTILIGLEAKRYQATSALPLDELKYKLADAATQPEPVDIWVLAATREISDTNARELRMLGDQHGIAVTVLDWNATPGALPRLATFCAVGRETCLAFLGNPPDLAEAFESIVSHPDFPEAADRLCNEFLAPEMGYPLAAARIGRWMNEAQCSGTAAHTRLHGANNLQELGVPVEPRRGLFEALDSWWSSTDTPTAALIGQEGHGKTWASLGWLAHLAQADQAVPLTLFVAARDVPASDLKGLLPKLLHDRTGIRSPEFWDRRLQLWGRSQDARRQILVLIDGADQNWLCNWTEAIQPLLDPSWNGIFRFLLTLRPDRWATLGQMQTLKPAPFPIDVPRFTDVELDGLLIQTGHTRAEFNDDVLNLMRVPRLSLLAIARRAELQRSGDITAERLMYEDWKHRLGQRRNNLNFSDIEFQAFVEQIGREVREARDTISITRRQLSDRLTIESGLPDTDLRAALSEIVDGRWVIPIPGKPNKFKVDQSLAPYALGLALAAELRGSLDENEVDSRIAGYVDPFNHQSLGVAILRAATTVALIDPDVGQEARRALIERWMSEQNFSQKDFVAFWRIVGFDAELFCDLMEEAWLKREGGSFSDEVLIKAASHLADFPDAAATLNRRLTAWLGWVWLNPLDGLIIGGDPDAKRAGENAARTRANLITWHNRPAASQFPPIMLKSDGNVSWLSHRALGIISYTARAPFAGALVAWALSRSIMEFQRHEEEVAWLLRLNDRDRAGTDAAIKAAVDILKNDGSVIALRAASWLLESSGDPEFEGASTEIRVRAKADLGIEIAQFHGALSRSLGAIDPASTPKQPKDAEVPAGKDLWLFAMGNGSADTNYKQVRLKLAHLDPARLARILHEAAESAATRNDEEIVALLREVHRLLPVLTVEQRHQLLDRLSARHAMGTDPKLAAQLANACGRVAMWGRTPAEQIDILTTAPPAWFESFPPAVFTPLRDDDWDMLRNALDGAEDPVRRRYLFRYAEKRAWRWWMKSWPGLAEWVFDLDDDIRVKAQHMAFDSRNPDALRAFADSGWTIEGCEKRVEAAYGALLLITAKLDLGIDVAFERYGAQATAFALERHPDNDMLLDQFEAFVKGEVEALTRPMQRSYPNYWGGHVGALSLLVDRRGADFLPWFGAWLDARPKLFGGLMFDAFPLISLCRVLLEKAPVLGERLWRYLIETLKTDFTSRDDLILLPLGVADLAKVEHLFGEIVDHATTDLELFDLATAAAEHGHQGWLLREIRRMAADTAPAVRAREFTLLGFCDRSTEADSVWNDLEKAVRASGWLAEVFGYARHAYRRNGLARYWFNRCLTVTRPDEASAAFELFLAAADGRAVDWTKTEFKRHEANLDAERTVLVNVPVDRIQDSVKAMSEARKSTLFGTRTIGQTQAPWS